MKPFHIKAYSPTRKTPLTISGKWISLSIYALVHGESVEQVEIKCGNGMIGIWHKGQLVTNLMVV